MIELFLFSMVLGSVAGLLAGLFGLGGGVIIVPALVWLFTLFNFPNELVMIMAIATSLATIVFTAISSALTHHKLGAIKWSYVVRLVPGVMLGAGCGAVVADLVNGGVLKIFFILYLILVAASMAWSKERSVSTVNTEHWIDYLMGNVIGFFSSILGIGGGSLTVPYLLSRQVAMKNAVAISSVCGLPIAIAGALTYIKLGWQESTLPAWSVGYVYLPVVLGIIICSIVTAPIGARLASQLPAKKLKKYFSLVLFGIALKMMLG